MTVRLEKLNIQASDSQVVHVALWYIWIFNPHENLKKIRNINTLQTVMAHFFLDMGLLAVF